MLGHLSLREASFGWDLLLTSKTKSLYAHIACLQYGNKIWHCFSLNPLHIESPC